MHNEAGKEKRKQRKTKRKWKVLWVKGVTKTTGNQETQASETTRRILLHQNNWTRVKLKIRKNRNIKKKPTFYVETNMYYLLVDQSCFWILIILSKHLSWLPTATCCASAQTLGRPKGTTNYFIYLFFFTLTHKKVENHASISSAPLSVEFVT